MAVKIFLIVCLAVMGVGVLPAPVRAQAVDLEKIYQERQAPPRAEAAPEKPVAGSHVVTSVSKCFDDLGPEEAAEIKRNSLTPYADCQKRLRDRAKDRKAQDSKEPVAETPRNYRRVIEREDEAVRPVAREEKKTAAPRVKEK